MAKIAYRFVPCDEGGRRSEDSQFTLIRDEAEEIEVALLIAANLLGFSEWEVVELRASSSRLGSAWDADGKPIPLGGTLVCRDVRRD